jgi:hypothetical protein
MHLQGELDSKAQQQMSSVMLSWMSGSQQPSCSQGSDAHNMVSRPAASQAQTPGSKASSPAQPRLLPQPQPQQQQQQDVQASPGSSQQLLLDSSSQAGSLPAAAQQHSRGNGQQGLRALTCSQGVLASPGASPGASSSPAAQHTARLAAAAAVLPGAPGSTTVMDEDSSSAPAAASQAQRRQGQAAGSRPSSDFAPFLQQLRGSSCTVAEGADTAVGAGAMRPPAAAGRRCTGGVARVQQQQQLQQQVNSRYGGIARFFASSRGSQGASAASTGSGAVVAEQAVKPSAAEDELSAYMQHGTPSKQARTPDKASPSQEEAQRLRAAAAGEEHSPGSTGPVPCRQQQQAGSPLGWASLRRSLFVADAAAGASAAELAAAGVAAAVEGGGASNSSDDDVPAWMRSFQHSQTKATRQGQQQQQQQQQQHESPVRPKAQPIVFVDLLTPSPRQHAPAAAQPKGSPECIDLVNS